MNFDPTGGYKGKPTVKYNLEDINDGETREMSSTSKAFAKKMMKVKVGDTIVITCGESDQGNKDYSVEVLRSEKQSQALQAEKEVNDDLFDDDDEEDEIEM